MGVEPAHLIEGAVVGRRVRGRAWAAAGRIGCSPNRCQHHGCLTLVPQEPVATRFVAFARSSDRRSRDAVAGAGADPRGETVSDLARLIDGRAARCRGGQAAHRHHLAGSPIKRQRFPHPPGASNGPFPEARIATESPLCGSTSGSAGDPSPGTRRIDVWPRSTSSGSRMALRTDPRRACDGVRRSRRCGPRPSAALDPAAGGTSDRTTLGRALRTRATAARVSGGADGGAGR